MAKFKPYRIDQRMLLPPSLHDFIPANHLARLIVRVVEKLNTGAIEDTYSELGQNTYHPRVLIKLLFYGYAAGERSGRVIARRCETDTAYMSLAQMYRPDFRTINDFRKNNTEGLSQYFVDIVRMCKELGLVRIGQINIDSTNINRVAGRKLNKYHQDHFTYDKERDEYRCPEGFRLRAYKVRRQDAGYGRWRQVIYKGLSCPSCGKRDLCTTQRYRTIARDDRKELLEEMRKRSETPEGQKKYTKRLYTVEPIFGHLKHNLGYRHFLIRGLEKVRTEFKLMCIRYNLKKMNQLLATTP